MNEVREFLAIGSIDANLTGENKKALFQHLSQAAARETGLPAKTILSALTERERLGSTGFGAGVAIPHGKIADISSVFGYFARLTQPIAYDAVDDMPVDLVFLLLSPVDAGADHLKALASASRALRDRQTAAKLRGARSEDAIYALLAGTESVHA